MRVFFNSYSRHCLRCSVRLETIKRFHSTVTLPCSCHSVDTDAGIINTDID